MDADCPNGCGFLATPQIGGLGRCDQTLTLKYAGSTLTMGLGLRTSIPFTWSVSLFALNTAIPLWSVPIPSVSPAVSFDVPFAGFPAVGQVFGVSALSAPTGEVVCADFATVLTSSGGSLP